MKLQHFLFVLSVLAIGCHSSSKSDQEASVVNSDTSLVSGNTSAEQNNATEEMIEETMNTMDGGDFVETVYIVIADTASNYFKLRNKMIDLHNQSTLPIDTMHRYFNTNHNMIMLPDSLEDELYGTSYFMRRYPSDHLSIEYLDHYDTSATENCMAIFGGIYSEKSTADSLLKTIKPKFRKAYVLPVEMWMGCMH